MRMAAIPAAPAATHSRELAAVTPPSAKTGTRSEARHASRSASRPCARTTCVPLICLAEDGREEDDVGCRGAAHLFEGMAGHADEGARQKGPHLVRCEFALGGGKVHPIGARCQRNIGPSGDEHAGAGLGGAYSVDNALRQAAKVTPGKVLLAYEDEVHAFAGEGGAPACKRYRCCFVQWNCESAGRDGIAQHVWILRAISPFVVVSRSMG